jgi:Multiubiquitin
MIMTTVNAAGGSVRTDEDEAAKAEIADETFVFREVRFENRKETGANVAEAAGAHPVEQFVVLSQLATRELETLRPTELVTLTAGARFFVIRGDGTDRFQVDGPAMEWPRQAIKGLAIKKLLGREDDDIDLVLERADEPDRIIEDDDEVRIGEPGVESFRTTPSKKHFTIIVDGESYEPAARTMTPNQIIIQAAHKEPATHHLVQITKSDRISYQGKGDDPIRLRDGMRFQVISTGPTPVSDPRMTIGATAFMEGLRALGCEPAYLPDLHDHIAFDYVVESGKYRGTKVRIGLVIPPDFPMTPPSGPYVSPEIHPINPSGPHPLGAVHKEQARVFDQKSDVRWQYWSRPFPDWPASKRTVGSYMSHIWKLWDSQ